MKKLLPIFLLLTALATTHSLHAQTEEGTILVELGYTPASNGLFGDGQNPPSTGVQFWTSDGNTIFGLGAEGGYFIMDDLALKAGFGFVSSSPDEGDGTSSVSYKLGAKYYVNSIIPIQLDFTGSTREDQDTGLGTLETPDPFWLGLQAGYAIFLADNVSFEPALRYNSSLNSDFSDTGVLEFRFGLAFFMN